MSSLVAPGTVFGMELERFTRPLSLDRPAGESVRYDPVFAQIREARREDDPSVPQGQWQHELKRADWKEVARLCLGVLEKRSRDLQLGAWLTEAWIRTHAFAGAREGLTLLHALCQWQWEHLHPALDARDPEARAAPFAWINERLSVSLALAPVTAPEGAETTRYTWADWQEALRRDAQSAAAPPPPATRRGDPPAEEPAGPTRSRFGAAQSLTSTAFYRALAADAAGAHAATVRLQEILDEKMGKDAPSLARFAGVARAVADWAAGVLADRHEPLIPAPEPQSPAQEAPMDAPVQVPAPPAFAPRAAGPVTSRDEAYRRLAEAADYLMRTEPHSPVPYLIMRAVSWGNMSLAELLHEFIDRADDLVAIQVLLGMRKKE